MNAAVGAPLAAQGTLGGSSFVRGSPSPPPTRLGLGNFQQQRLVKLNKKDEEFQAVTSSFNRLEVQDSEESRIMAAKKKVPPLAPYVISPIGITDLSSVMLRNRIIFIGQPINSQVAQRVISQLMALAAIDEEKDIQIYINCPGGSTYSVLAIYDCMSWIKPRVSTVCFGMAASQGALILAGGTKGLRFAMPNSRVMIHQPQGGCGGTMEDVRRQVNEVVASRDKIDKMYAAFTGRPLEVVQTYTERDHFFSAAEAMEFGLIDGLIETEY